MPRVYHKYTIDDYEITKDGQVINIHTGKTVKPQLNGTGYYRVSIGKKLMFVHRLVAQKYIQNPNNLPQVNHKDGNKLNNCVDNLEWVTNKENSLHALHNGRMRIEEKHQFAKLARADVSFIKSHPEMSRNDLAVMFNIDPHTISDIRNGRTWKTVEKIC